MEVPKIAELERYHHPFSVGTSFDSYRVGDSVIKVEKKTRSAKSAQRHFDLLQKEYDILRKHLYPDNIVDQSLSLEKYGSDFKIAIIQPEIKGTSLHQTLPAILGRLIDENPTIEYLERCHRCFLREGFTPDLYPDIVGRLPLSDPNTILSDTTPILVNPNLNRFQRNFLTAGPVNVRIDKKILKLLDKLEHQK